MRVLAESDAVFTYAFEPWESRILSKVDSHTGAAAAETPPAGATTDVDVAGAAMSMTPRGKH